MKNFIFIVGIAAATTCASAQIVLDPGFSFDLFTTNSNDGYNDGRGAVFSANTNFTLNTVGLTNNFSAGTSVTYELYQVISTSGDVLTGSTLLGSTTFNTTALGLVSHTASIGALSIVSGNDYLVRAIFTDVALENWFYNYDQNFDAPVNLGDVTLIDGTQNGDTSNTVLPEFTLNVPAPSSVFGLGLAGLVVTRRRRS